ncbi:recombinase [Pseudoalteromonas umbrosa]|uniref:recombinase n=1 Tax=Pseudoalteromonas umbrosa TaxID=3048489 RepID=UPI0024C29AF4|nr:recombinase [Pseudoalteromonas sp. B95]MDK1289820.1 recombinase [Pseudoalteromonas sp. B95]
MAPRKRLFKNRDLPPYLYFDKNAGYTLKLVSGKRRVISQNRTEAIIIANEYNRIKRSNEVLDSLLAEENSGTPFSDLVDKIIERVTNDRSPGESLKAQWKNDSLRVKEFFTMPGSEITLTEVTEYLDKYHPNASNNVFNRKLSFLEMLFDYAKDIGEMEKNPAALKIKKPKEEKVRKPLDIDAFNRIRAAAPLWLKTAMDLTMQTTHAVLEISRIKYKLKKAEAGKCGCIWYETPQKDGSATIYGELAIHRQKTKKTEASHVIIPINETIKAIIDTSRDRIASPYVVHRLPKTRSNPVSKEVDHVTQIVSRNISKEFSKVRDDLGLYKELQFEERPTYHEIRGLSARIIEELGHNPQHRMGHADSKSTKIYTEQGKPIEWVQVPNVVVATK